MSIVMDVTFLYVTVVCHSSSVKLCPARWFFLLRIEVSISLLPFIHSHISHISPHVLNFAPSWILLHPCSISASNAET